MNLGTSFGGWVVFMLMLVACGGKEDSPYGTGGAGETPGASATSGAESPQEEPPVVRWEPVKAPRPHPALTDPSKAKEQAPDVYRVRMETTVGDILIECHREWSPLGADRFYNLCMIGYFDDVRFHRVVPNFVAQFGYQGDPAANKAWSAATIKDDTVTAGKLQSNVRGTVTFAKATAPHTRSTQVFINFADNLQLDPPHYVGFSPFGKVLEGMDQLKNLHSGYGERVNEDPQSRQGNAHIAVAYPELGFIKKAVVLRKVTK